MFKIINDDSSALNNLIAKLRPFKQSVIEKDSIIKNLQFID